MLKVVALPFSAHNLVDMVKHLNCIVSQYKNLMGRPVEIECNPKNTHNELIGAIWQNGAEKGHFNTFMLQVITLPFTAHV